MGWGWQGGFAVLALLCFPFFNNIRRGPRCFSAFPRVRRCPPRDTFACLQNPSSDSFHPLPLLRIANTGIYTSAPAFRFQLLPEVCNNLLYEFIMYAFAWNTQFPQAISVLPHPMGLIKLAHTLRALHYPPTGSLSNENMMTACKLRFNWIAHRFWFSFIHIFLCPQAGAEVVRCFCGPLPRLPRPNLRRNSKVLRSVSNCHTHCSWLFLFPFYFFRYGLCTLFMPCNLKFPYGVWPRIYWIIWIYTYPLKFSQCLLEFSPNIFVLMQFSNEI